jgi:hypothetical protein
MLSLGCSQPSLNGTRGSQSRRQGVNRSCATSFSSPVGDATALGGQRASRCHLHGAGRLESSLTLRWCRLPLSPSCWAGFSEVQKLLTRGSAPCLPRATLGCFPSRRARPDRRTLGVVTTLVSSESVAVVLSGQPSPGLDAHQEAPPSSVEQRSLRHASASAESLPTSSPAEGRSHTSPAACPA